MLGKILVHKAAAGETAGRIVETEAYLEGDPASHSCRGKTPRNAIMWGRPGRAYVYLNYGMYHCFNAVTEPEGKAGAVLVRALEPTRGIALMQKRRHRNDEGNLANGPGKLTQALGIGKDENGANLTRGKLVICDENDRAGEAVIAVTGRIGISQANEAPLRFIIEDNPFVSPHRKQEVFLEGTKEQIKTAFESGRLAIPGR